jgi:hypothetical protein
MNVPASSRTPRTRGWIALASRIWPAASGLRILAGLWLLTGTGCISFHREAPRPGRTTFSSPLVILPAAIYGDLLVVEAKWDRYGPYHFLVDTGAVAPLVTPELAKRYGDKNAPPPPLARVPMRAADGSIAYLPATTLRRIELGDARFENIPARIHDCTAISAHLGIKIDGILGFSLFRETLLTLDYPHQRVVLQPRNPAPLLPGVTIPFNNANKVPLIPVSLGDTSFIALIDSGSDSPVSLNPHGLQPKFSVAPRPGPTVATLAGDHTPQLGRLAGALAIGTYQLVSPVVEITDELSWIGGGVLKNFSVTFDQERNQTTFYRESTEPVVFPPRRNAGLSFNKSPAYWRVVSVLPGSAAAAAEIVSGDLVTRIDGEPVAKWDFRRYERLVATANEITFTFLQGSREHDIPLKVFELVP